MSATMQSLFDGQVHERSYSQVHDFEFVPNYSTYTDSNGNTSRYIASYTRNLVTAKTLEQEFRFSGLTEAQAHSTDSITVTTAAGGSYTFVPETKIVDGSSGSRVFEVERVDVERIHVTPHLWDLVVRRSGTRYYLNGTLISMSNYPTWLPNSF